MFRETHSAGCLRIFGGLVLCAGLAMLHGPARAGEWELSVPPVEGEKYKSADFRFWLPDGLGRVRAILIRQHGCGRKGLDHADDLQWQALAAKHGCGLLGTHYQPTTECADWFTPTAGSERALLVALKQFSELSGRPEVADVPWALWGHSGGSLWSLGLTYRQPERVIGVLARSGAIPDAPASAHPVPVLFNYGEQEKTGRFANVHLKSSEALAKNRPQGALWAPAIDPLSSHDCRRSRDLAIPFFDHLLSVRLPQPGDAGGPFQLRPLDETQAWLGDPQTFEIAPAAKYAGDVKQAAWLPSETVARAWQAYCKTGAVPDLTPPPVPTNVRVHALADGFALTWSADIDLESGCRHFTIYRDDQAIGKLGGRETAANKDRAFQTWNYGDEPEPRPSGLWFALPDETTSKDSSDKLNSVYHVSQTNLANVESPRSANATLVPRDAEEGFVSLFNGRDLSGWTVQAEAGKGPLPAAESAWQAQEGLLVAQPGSGWLRSEKEFGNFVLRLEWRVGPNGNSGIFLRVPPLQPGQHPHVQGMEVQVLDDFGSNYVGKLKCWQYTGSLYGVFAAERSTYAGPDVWNRMEITCRGDEITVALNNQIVTRAHQAQAPALRERPRRGAIGLQNHGTQVEYRAIRIRALD